MSYRSLLKKEKFWQRRRPRAPKRADVDLDGYRRTNATTDYVLDCWSRAGRCLADVLKDLTDRCKGKPLFVSAELPHYGTVLGELCY